VKCLYQWYFYLLLQAVRRIAFIVLNSLMVCMPHTGKALERERWEEGAGIIEQFLSFYWYLKTLLVAR